jgi:hypothetical protein
MKINRNYTLDEENVKMLSTIHNASGLINDLLTRHFKQVEMKTPEDIEKRRQELIIKIEAEEKLKKLNG